MAIGIHLDSAHRELLLRAQGGDTSAFEKLVERHRDQIYGFGLRMTRSETVAMEIAQESFLSAHLHLAQFRNETDFSSWTYQIAARHALLRLPPVAAPVGDPLRAKPSSNHRPLAESAADDLSKDLDQEVLNADLRRAIELAADELPQGYREVLLLKDMADLSYEQIANICRASIPAIKSLLHEGRLRLRATIEQFYQEVQAACTAGL